MCMPVLVIGVLYTYRCSSNVEVLTCMRTTTNKHASPSRGGGALKKGTGADQNEFGTVENTISKTYHPSLSKAVTGVVYQKKGTGAASADQNELGTGEKTT